MTFKPVDTAIIMTVGPCIDATDFKSLKEAITYDVTGMDVSLIVEKTDGTIAVTAITLTSGGSNDWTHTDGGYYEVEITATQNIEEGTAYLRGICTGVLPFESGRYEIVPANIYDSFVKGTDTLDTNVTSQANIDFGILQKVSINAECGTALTDYGANTIIPDVAGTSATLHGTTDGKIDALNNLSASEVNTEVSDVFKVDTIVEMAQGALPANPTMEEILNYLYRQLRNKSETTASETAVYNDAGTDKIFKASISYNEPATTFTKDEYGTGA